MSTKRKKAECDTCSQVRTVQLYDGPGFSNMEMCDSCANIQGADDLSRTNEGRIMLVINSKLDLLMGRKR